MIIIDGIKIGAITGAIVSGAGGFAIKANSTAPTDVQGLMIYGTIGGVIGGVIGDIVTLNSPIGIVVGATIGSVSGAGVLILKEVAKIG